MAAAMSKAFHLRLIDLVEARRLALLLLLAATALPALAAERITVQQLEQAVSAAQGKGDKDVADQLGGMELTERLTTARLEKLKVSLPGDQSRQALLALADVSAFLELPKADILPLPAPNAADQGHIMSMATDFVMATLPRLPNFLATRTTTRFQDLKVNYELDEPVIIPSQGFQFVDKHNESILYRDGRELVETDQVRKSVDRAPPQSGLSNWGVFGRLLGVVMADVLNGKMGWGHWEQGPAGPVAVFRYAVGEDKSTYTVKYCCILTSDGAMHEFWVVPPYHGEIAVDPRTGTVLRLVVKSELKPNHEVFRSDVAVEYGSVDIGGKSFICPSKSISIYRVRQVIAKGIKYVGDDAYYDDVVGTPKVTAINDVVFDNYHQFRSEIRILPQDTSEQDGSKPAPTLGSAPKAPPTQ